MQSDAMKKHIGNVVVLDLVKGIEITARVKSVDETTVTCSKPRVFVPIPNPNNPNDVSVMCLMYGHPMYEADEELVLDLSHIITVFKPSAPQVDEYAKQTSSIVTAPAGALDELDRRSGELIL